MRLAPILSILPTAVRSQARQASSGAGKVALPSLTGNLPKCRSTVRAPVDNSIINLDEIVQLASRSSRYATTASRQTTQSKYTSPDLSMPSLHSVAGRHCARLAGSHGHFTADESSTIGSWEVLRCIHHGAYADVFLGRPADSTQSCADFVLRVLRSERADDPVAVAMMCAEVQAARAVVHPHLIPVLDAQLRSSPRHLVFPRLEGVSLKVLYREQQCTLRRALRAIRQVAEALEALHEAGWRHGDVKPANVIVSPEGHATLIDLSMAAPADEDSSETVHQHAGKGTARYAAPELTAGEAAGRASDIYSLGATLFELLAHRAAFTGSTAAELADAHRQQPVPDLERWAPVEAHGAARIIRRMLQKSRHDRPTAADVVDELVALEIDAFVH